MARGAANSLLHMNAVVEKNKVWQLIDARPMNRLPGRQTVADWRQNGCILPDLRMTGHARLRGRHSRKRGFFHRRMTVPAIESQSRDVMLVTERSRLRERNILFGGVRRTIEGIDDTPK